MQKPQAKLSPGLFWIVALLSILPLVLLMVQRAQDQQNEDDSSPTPAPSTPSAAYLSEDFSLQGSAEDFVLSRSDGTDFRLAEQQDKITILYFGFTACPDICPLTLSTLSHALRELDMPLDRIQLAMVTVDPERDSPEMLARYLGRYNERYIGLTGDENALQSAYDLFEITAEEVPLNGSAMTYTIDHSGDVFLIAPGMAEVRRFYHSATSDNFVHDLGLMLDSYSEELGARATYMAALLSVAQDRQIVDDFTLQRTDGGEFRLSEQSGKLTILYYGFSSCPDICPLTLSELNRVLAAMDYPEEIQFAMITLDPERDTPEILNRYVTRFNEDFIALYGDETQTAIAKDVFGVVAFRRAFDDSALSYTIDHTADLFIIGPGGEYITRIPYGTSRDNIEHDLRLILSNEFDEGD